MADWQKLVHDNIKVTLVAHIAIKGRNLGTISIDPQEPVNPNGYDNLKLELFAGEISTAELCLLRELLYTASHCVNRDYRDPISRLRQMQLDLAKIKAYKFCLT